MVSKYKEYEQDLDDFDVGFKLPSTTDALKKLERARLQAEHEEETKKQGRPKKQRRGGNICCCEREGCGIGPFIERN